MIHLYCNICRFYFTCYDWSNISLTSYSSRKVGRYQIDHTEMVYRRRAVNTMAKRKGQKDKLRYIKHYTEN